MLINHITLVYTIINNRYIYHNVGKTIINHPFGNGLYHPFIVKLTVVCDVCDCFININRPLIISD